MKKKKRKRTTKKRGIKTRRGPKRRRKERERERERKRKADGNKEEVKEDEREREREREKGQSVKATVARPTTKVTVGKTHNNPVEPVTATSDPRKTR